MQQWGFTKSGRWTHKCNLCMPHWGYKLQARILSLQLTSLSALSTLMQPGATVGILLAMYLFICCWSMVSPAECLPAASKQLCSVQKPLVHLCAFKNLLFGSKIPCCSIPAKEKVSYSYISGVAKSLQVSILSPSACNLLVTSSPHLKKC